jgi:glycosyltransferase involved in cell wall biosynthesis
MRTRGGDTTDLVRVAITLEQCWHRVPGGTALAAVELARALAALADTEPHRDLELVGVSARHREPPGDPGWRPPIPVRQLPLPREVLYETWHRWARPLVERATGPVDVVHATGVAVPGTRSPLVVTINDLAFLEDPSRATRHGLRFFRRATELARRRATLVVCPSQATIDECVGAGFEPECLRLVPLGVDVRAASGDDVARVTRQYGVAAPYVLFVGTIEPRKNLPRVIRAFERVGRRDLQLVLVGPTGWNEDVAPGVAALGERARALGFVPRRDLGALYAGATAFVYPSLREGFGLPVLEAMAQGTPVVTSSVTATAEVAADAALLVDPFDVDAITAALDRVVTDDDLARRLGDAGRARAATFPWSTTAAMTLDVYDEAVAR